MARKQMRVIDLDKLDLASARRAIDKARRVQSWCVRDRKDKSLYRVRARRRQREQRPNSIHFVKLIFGPGFRYATCTCRGFIYNADAGRPCWAIARAYFKHQRNLKRDAERQRLREIAA
jgi:hypothetical protein